MRHDAVSAHAAIGRLEADDAARRRRNTNRTARIRAQCAKHQTRRHGARRSARGSATDEASIPRIAAAPEVLVVARCPETELVEVQGTQIERTGRAQVQQDGRRRPDGLDGPLVMMHRAAGRNTALVEEHVLVGHRDAVKRTAYPPRCAVGIGRTGLGTGTLPVHRDEAVEVRLQSIDALDACLGDLERAQLPLPYGVRGLAQAEIGHAVGHASSSGA